MKKVLSAVLAGAMMAAMAVPAFAADPVKENTVYDSDGEIISVKGTGDVWGDDIKVPFIAKGGTIESVGDINIDGVVPGITMYIPLGLNMDALIKKASTTNVDEADAIAAGIQAVKDKAVTVTNSDPVDNTATPSQAPKTIDKVGDIVSATGSYDTTANYYFNVDVDTVKGYYQTAHDKYITDHSSSAVDYSISLDSLTNSDYFKFDVDKDDGGSYVKKVEVVDDKKLDGVSSRTAYLKVQLNDSTTTSDLKSTGTITFKAKSDSASYTSGSKKLTRGDVWSSGDDIKFNYTFWINNVKAKNDDNPDSGDRVYFDPDDNEDNTLIWGDDRAGLFFEANDDASKFYARLSTKSDSEVYSEYGDPVNADLWFFDFVGSSTIPATSRATLTLGIPWDEDDDYTPNPEDCFIYEKQEDGTLVDVTDKFTYDEDNDGTTEIEGWSIKTRTLGTYVISDTELDLDAVASDDVDEASDDGDTAVTDGTGKEIPNTGSSDMVNVAVVAAAVSLAAAGAVAFKKASK